MGTRSVRLVFASALTAAVFAAAASASSPFTVFPIPGLEGKRIQVGGVARVADGGAIVAAAVGGGAAAARLNADGSVDLAYGRDGVARPHVGRQLRATALAVDPANGDAWIGFAVGHRARSEIIALDGRGRVRTRFGVRGHLTLPGPGGPAALAWQRGTLLVATDSDPCRGCALSTLDATSGKRKRFARVSPTFQDNGRMCRIRAVTSAAFTPDGGGEFGTAAVGPGCSASLVSYAPPAVPSAQPTLFGGVFPLIDLAGQGRDLCLTASGPSKTLLGTATAPAGRLIAATPLGDGACAALIKPRGYPAAMVLQARKGQHLANSYAIPRTVAPLGLFRCHQHLLVVGRRGRNAVVVVVPVTAGPHASAASTAAAGCTA